MSIPYRSLAFRRKWALKLSLNDKLAGPKLSFHQLQRCLCFGFDCWPISLQMILPICSHRSLKWLKVTHEKFTIWYQWVWATTKWHNKRKLWNSNSEHWQECIITKHFMRSFTKPSVVVGYREFLSVFWTMLYEFRSMFAVKYFGCSNETKFFFFE